MNAAERRHLEESLRDNPGWQRVMLPYILRTRKNIRGSLTDSLTEPAELAAARSARRALAQVLEMAGYQLQDDVPVVPTRNADSEE